MIPLLAYLKNMHLGQNSMLNTFRSLQVREIGRPGMGFAAPGDAIGGANPNGSEQKENAPRGTLTGLRICLSRGRKAMRAYTPMRLRAKVHWENPRPGWQ